MLKDKIQGAILGTVATAIIMTTIPVIAKVGQEAIIVNYNNIKISLDGRQIQTENEPFTYNGRTYLPVRDLAEALGLAVDWDGTTNTAILNSGGQSQNQGQQGTTQPTPTPTANTGAENDYVNYSSMTAYLEAKGLNASAENQRLGGSIIGDYAYQYYLNYFLKPNMAFVPMLEFPDQQPHNNDFPSGITVKEAKWEYDKRETSSYWNDEYSEYRHLGVRDRSYLVLEYNGRTYMSLDSYAKHRGYDDFSFYINSNYNAIPNGLDYKIEEFPVPSEIKPNAVSGGQYYSWLSGIRYHKVEGDKLHLIDIGELSGIKSGLPSNLVIRRAASKDWTNIFVDVEAMDRYINQATQVRTIVFEPAR